MCRITQCRKTSVTKTVQRRPAAAMAMDLMNQRVLVPMVYPLTEHRNTSRKLRRSLRVVVAQRPLTRQRHGSDDARLNGLANAEVAQQRKCQEQQLRCCGLFSWTQNFVSVSPP